MTAVWISSATCVMTLGGGLLALRLQAYQGLVFAFCAGALIAGALMEVVPDALELLESPQLPFHHHHLLLACTLGFLCFYLLEHTAHHREARGIQTIHPTHSRHAGVWGVTGIIIHSFLDGFAIGQAFHAGEEIGWAIALGIILHKLADGASVAGVMLGTQHTTRATTAMLGLTALAPLVGALTQSLFVIPLPLLALLLGWFAGVFLYLGAGNLLPIAHAVSRSRQLPFVTLAGVVFIYVAQLLAHH